MCSIFRNISSKGVLKMKNTVCCFGHREIIGDEGSSNEITKLKDFLYLFVEVLICKSGAEVFMSGRHGEFDNLFTNVVRSLKEKYPHIKLILIEPYFSNTLNTYKEYFNSIYDSIIVVDEESTTHFKKSIVLRNQWMVEHSDYVIAYVNRKSGGAYMATKYAQKLKKCIFSIGEIDFMT